MRARTIKYKLRLSPLGHIPVAIEEITARMHGIPDGAALRINSPANLLWARAVRDAGRRFLTPIGAPRRKWRDQVPEIFR